MNPNSVKLFNEHIRNDDDCSIYYKLDYSSYKACLNHGRNTIWGAYNDLENILNIAAISMTGEKRKYHLIMTTYNQ